MRIRIALCLTFTIVALAPAVGRSERAATLAPAPTATAATAAKVESFLPVAAAKPAVRLTPPTTAPPTTTTTVAVHHLCPRAFDAVLTVGGTLAEANLADRIAWRESRCTLVIKNWSTRTHDDSWGPFQINYYGSLRADRIRLVGEPSTNIQSWERAASNFLKLGRTAGWCHWDYPNYCS